MSEEELFHEALMKTTAAERAAFLGSQPQGSRTRFLGDLGQYTQ
jgi:hypothetical protein